MEVIAEEAIAPQQQQQQQQVGGTGNREEDPLLISHQQQQQQQQQPPHQQHQTKEDDHSNANTSRNKKTSKNSGTDFDWLLNYRWKTKQNLVFLWCGLLVLSTAIFYFKVVDQSNDEGSRNKLIAANALFRLNHDIRYLPPPKCTVTVLIARHCNDYGVYAKDDVESGDKHCSYVGYERTRYFASQFAGSHNDDDDDAIDDDAFENDENDAPSADLEQQYAIKDDDDDKKKETKTTNSKKQTRWPAPIGLYALLPEQPQGINYRQIETLLPLARQSNVSIHVVGEPAHVAKSIFQQLQTMPSSRSSSSSNSNNNNSTDSTDTENIDSDEEGYCGQVIVVAWKHAFIPDVAAVLGCGPNQGCPSSYPDGEFDLVWQLRFVHEPPAPEEDVPQLIDQKSPLILDDYKLLSHQQAKERSKLSVRSTNSNPKHKHENDNDDDDLDDDPTAAINIHNNNDDFHGTLDHVRKKSTSKKRQHKSQNSNNHLPGWTVYGTVTNQNFDPLQTSHHEQSKLLLGKRTGEL